jgi:hypothetical protein
MWYSTTEFNRDLVGSVDPDDRDANKVAKRPTKNKKNLENILLYKMFSLEDLLEFWFFKIAC